MAFGLVRQNGLSPCPICLTPSSQFGELDVVLNVAHQPTLRRTISKERQQLKTGNGHSGEWSQWGA
eukprot:4263063-Prymnesium_polylepis.2